MPASRRAANQPRRDEENVTNADTNADAIDAASTHERSELAKRAASPKRTLTDVPGGALDVADSSPSPVEAGSASTHADSSSSSGEPSPPTTDRGREPGPPVSLEASAAAARIEPIVWPGLNALHPGLEHPGAPAPRTTDTSATNTERHAGPPKRLAFLVDASGSAIDTLPQVIDWLEQRVTALEPGQSFTILFFRAEATVEVPPLGMKRATYANKQRVTHWITTERQRLTPRGKSGMGEALRKVRAYKPDTLFLLCDGMVSVGSSGDAGEPVAQRVQSLLGEPVPRLHTVQFFYRGGAASLRSLSESFGGRYTFVAPQQTGEPGVPSWMRR